MEKRVRKKENAVTIWYKKIYNQNSEKLKKPTKQKKSKLRV
jgi:hypothetical protein